MFLYKQWDEFCRKLTISGFISTSASALVKKTDKQFIMLKHDVETNPLKALEFARIENKYSHKGTYYVQAYLLNNKRNVDILKQIQCLGHEVSYHHDVMDANYGNLNQAIDEFQFNIERFEKNGFSVQTVCQHGNPVVERHGYSSNRDFFRSAKVARLYENISEIMVNFKSKINKDYVYISDAGYGWRVIFDPENNDLIESHDKDTALGGLGEAIDILKTGNSVIISTHPHRWSNTVLSSQAKVIFFKIAKNMVICISKLPAAKKLLVKYYTLAKKI